MNQQNYQLPQQNSVSVIGRLTKDPEIRRTTSSKSVCKFDIAISSSFKDKVTGEWKDGDPTFIPIVVWGELAEKLADKIKKGMPVLVEGRLQTNSWTTTDGTKKSRLEVIASRVQILVKLEKEQTEEKADDRFVQENDTKEDDVVLPF